MTEEKYITEIKRLRSQMVAVATRYLDNADEAEDITQDALLKLWAMHEMLQESDVDRIAFTILKHLCIDELRRREFRKGKQAVDIDSIDVAMESDNPQEIEEREQQLMTAVSKLPSKQQMLLQMRYIKGKDVHTIAQITGSTEESIKKNLLRARNKVYKFMAAVVAIVVCAGLFTFLTNRQEEEPVLAKQAVKVEQVHKDTPTISDSEEIITAPPQQHGLAIVEPAKQPQQMDQIDCQEQTTAILAATKDTTEEKAGIIDVRNHYTVSNPERLAYTPEEIENLKVCARNKLEEWMQLQQEILEAERRRINNYALE